MTEEQLLAIEEREKNATPGKWDTDGDGSSYDPSWDQYASSWVTTPTGNWKCQSGCYTGTEMCQQMSDAEFIAHARTDIPALIQEVRRLRKLLEQKSNP